MNETPESAKSVGFALETLNIEDCSFSFRAFFAQPQSLQAINVDQLANTLLERFAEQNLSVADIALEKGDSLFGYSLKAHLFNRLFSVNVGAVAVEGTFYRLLTTADRGMAADCIKKLVEIFRTVLSRYCFFEAAIHAAFNSSTKSEQFFSNNAKGGLQLGGILAYKKLEQQLIRVEVDQSYSHPNAAFIDFRTTGMTLDEFLSSDPIWRKFFELIEGFNLRLNDV